MEATAVRNNSVGLPGWQPPRDFRDARVHMVGIGGSGMSGLAAVLLRWGAGVSGVDATLSRTLERLAKFGACVAQETGAAALPADAHVVVVSAAIRDTHPDVLAARARGIPVIKYAQLLGMLMGRRNGIAISGTHGKSTTTAWLAWVLRCSGGDPSFVVGAESPQLGGGSDVGDGEHFVVEACEYDRSFLNLQPRAAAILNIEEDHLDYYENLDEIAASFTEFAALVPPEGLLVLNGHDTRCRRIAERFADHAETFGLEGDVTWSATDVAVQDGCCTFDVCRAGERLGRVSLALPGKHNLLNALAVAALATHAGLPWGTIEAGLASYRGVKRRLEVRGAADGVRFVDDYAHHPTEVRATLLAARERYSPSRIWCVFQPHQHSRTRFLLEDFARSFDLADFVIVPEIFFVRDSERDRELVRATDLVDRIRERGRSAVHLPRFDDIVNTLVEQVRSGDLVITMGAGDIWKVADELVRRLRADLPS